MSSLSRIMEIVKIRCGMNRKDQIRTTGRGWNRHKVMEATKKKKVEELNRKELEEFEKYQEV